MIYKIWCNAVRKSIIRFNNSLKSRDVCSNFVGCLLSAQALEIYSRKEMENMKLMKKIFIFAAIVITGFYVTTGLMPILYSTFGFPDPET